MKCLRLLLLCLFVAMPALAVPKKEIAKNFDQRLTQLASAKKIQTFIKKHPERFPPLIDKSNSLTIIVEKENLKLSKDSFTIGIGYRQFFVKSSIKRVWEFYTSPKLYAPAYGLDQPSQVDKTAHSDLFKARIAKNIPILDNQDYTLEYTAIKDEPFYFQRARQFHDAEDFAIRDNLKIFTPHEEGTMIRAIAMIYPLRWYVRAMGPQMRSIMKSEMTKVSKSETCILEAKEQLTEALAKKCWELNK